MSNYQARAIHPDTGEVEMAWFLDNHFGRHRYGVAFSDGKIFPESIVQFPELAPGSVEADAMEGEG